MTRGQFKRLLIAIIVGAVLFLVLMGVTNYVSMEEQTTSYQLFNNNITNKKVANNIVKEMREYLKGYQNYSPDIDFNKAFTDTIIAQVMKKDYTEKLTNAENAPYIDILKQYFKVELLNISETSVSDTELEYTLIIGMDYVDIENNYKLYKNRQYSNEIDSNISFIDYLNVPENVTLSKNYITNYTVKYDIANEAYIYSKTSDILKLQIPTVDASETIPAKLAKIEYNVSLEPIEENKELFNIAKINADKEFADITNKKYDELTEKMEERYQSEKVDNIAAYFIKFYSLYRNCDLVKFIEQESKIKFVGYDNIKKTLIYEVEEYPYEECMKIFKYIDETTEAEPIKSANKFTAFKKLVDNKEVQKTKKLIELSIDKEGKLTESLLSKYMLPEKLLWNKDELEFSGIVAIDPKNVPLDYSNYFTVQEAPGFANRAAAVYAIRTNFKTDAEYLKYIDTKVKNSLKIIFNMEDEAQNDFYKSKCDELIKIIERTYEDIESEKTTEFNNKNSSLNGMTIKIIKTVDAYTMFIKCDSWEVETEE